MTPESLRIGDRCNMKLLDLFCGGGLAGAGYWQSGCFREICGIDNNPDMKHVYPFDFVCADAITLTYDFLLQFDFIHASPPCQAYSYATPDWARGRHLKLIPGTHLMLKASGLPHVIENVPGSGLDLRPNLVLSGIDVGVPIKRPRYFHVADEKITNSQFSQISCRANSHINIDENSQISSAGNSKISGCHSSHLSINTGSNINLANVVNVHGDEYVSRHELIAAFGLRELPVSHLRRLTIDHIVQGIPPAMTKLIAQSLFPRLLIG